MFSSWRTLPGQRYAISRRSASCDTVTAPRPDSAASFCEKVLHEQRHVLAAFAQRRQLHRNHVEPVEQILAERSVGDHPREIGMRRRDHAHVDLDRVRVADALELALLQHAQQLRLERGAHRPDFVEEQRALVRLLEPSLARRRPRR